ncbi:MAG: hypothetical protein H7288_25665, partial [Kineosporiaceae bacterium]|nr:hypothetical protein [Aeromicrobium sp.]
MTIHASHSSSTSNRIGLTHAFLALNLANDHCRHLPCSHRVHRPAGAGKLERTGRRRRRPVRSRSQPDHRGFAWRRGHTVRSLVASRYYDLCDTTSCQVYRGVDAETATTDAAVQATAGKILNYNGSPAFTQFSSSSGGYSALGNQPYLKAKVDAYDDWAGNSVHDWTKSVSAA